MLVNQRGFAHLILLIGLLLIAVVAFFLYKSGYLKIPFLAVNNPLTQQQVQDPTVSLQTQYKNPFDQNTQYINPFAEYKNPFDALD